MQRVKMKLKQFFNLHPAPEHAMHKQPDAPEYKESKPDYTPSTDVQSKDKTVLDSKIAQAKEEKANSKPETATYEANQAAYDALADVEYQDDPIPLDEFEENSAKQEKQQEDAIPLDLLEKQPNEPVKQETKEKAPEKENKPQEMEKPKIPEKCEEPKQPAVLDYDPNLASLEGLVPPEESNEPDPIDDMF